MGKGPIGKVMTVRRNVNREVYVMKVVKKKALVDNTQCKDMRIHTSKTRKILSNLDHPFIVSLRFAFQTDAKLYIVLDYFNGSELFFHLKREGRFSERRSRFYSAQLCLALEFLHNNGIVYGDLKPENILLDCDGNVKIIDVSLCKQSLKGNMLVHAFGSVDGYTAPEILQVGLFFAKIAVYILLLVCLLI